MSEILKGRIYRDAAALGVAIVLAASANKSEASEAISQASQEAVCIESALQRPTKLGLTRRISGIGNEMQEAPLPAAHYAGEAVVNEAGEVCDPSVVQRAYMVGLSIKQRNYSYFWSTNENEAIAGSSLFLSPERTEKICDADKDGMVRMGATVNIEADTNGLIGDKHDEQVRYESKMRAVRCR